ncbi:unnamed protein product [Adineta ricciae]|uniref:Cyclic nucleotide-binding domain-containing protein n=1 Tax=Adineta ricciae TaxID=249248 RepID=A0A814DCC3_ADIRI|nr:unnamed protein product [Adineta ricciae]
MVEKFHEQTLRFFNKRSLVRRFCHSYHRGYMVGIFVFSSIIGQVGNVIANRNASRLEFERLLDGAKQYMRSHNVPPEMQRRVQRWYDYSWSRGRMSGAGDVHSIKLLPDKLKTELALHVNLGTLKKVTIFQECQPEFLHDLVLKMRAYIFTPGDIICRKGEVAREMFIIADGVLEVVNEKNEVLTRMGAGDFFGEIGILNIDGANRRTADVRSVGYSELFSLSKEDVLEGCRDYPEAERKLYEYAQNRLELEKSKKEAEAAAAERMRNPLHTLTSIASCLTQNRISTTSPNVAQTNAPNTNDENGNEIVTAEPALSPHTYRKGTAGVRAKLQSKYSTTRAQNSICDNQEKSSESQCPTTENPLIRSLRIHSTDLMSNIESVINNQLVSFSHDELLVCIMFFALSKEISGTEIS